MDLGHTIIIGDVHGMYDELQQLLAAVKYDPSIDRLVLTGDVIHKGPMQLECVQQLAGLGAELALGNHEEKQARFRSTLERHGEKKAMKMKGSREMMDLEEELSDNDRAWLESARLFVPVPGGVVVHAGIPYDLETIPSPEEIELMGKGERNRLMQVLRIRHVRGIPRSTVQLRLKYSGFGLTPENIDELLERSFVTQLAAKSEDHELVQVSHRRRGEFLSLGSETDDDPYWTDLYDGRFGNVYYGHQPWTGAERPRAHGQTFGMDLGAVFGGRLAAAVMDNEAIQTDFYTVAAGRKHADGLWD